ncbi:response regulator [Reichenbachiella carrageenanivorans]|uniref:histidine kinase n=1 Tax=Reichenbachiella carrageenanivorans TaxID=2979869 RepID=A0ABY6D0Q6_9BACT|nr:response regulator [Reichenbachiella carrageenanivorans]UXX78648.1 response regulator [Reichenbachiella carrageenanivorans]
MSIIRVPVATISSMLFALCLVFIANQLFGQASNPEDSLTPVQLKSAEDYIFIDSHAELLKGMEQVPMDWSAVHQLPDSLFQQNVDFERGRGVQWLRLGLNNDTKKSIAYMLWLYHNIDYVSMYLVNDRSELVTAARSGAMVRLADRPLQGYNQNDVQIPLTIAPGKYVLYLSIQNTRKLTQDHLKINRLILMGRSKFETQFSTSMFADGMFYGAGVLLLLLSLVLYLINGERLFIETFFMLLLTILFPFTFSGYLVRYALFDHPSWALYLEYFFGVFYIITFLLVSTSYLNTRQTAPTLRKFLYGIALTLGLIFVPALFNIYIYKTLIVLNGMGVFIAISCLYFSLKSKHRLAYYYSMTLLFGVLALVWFILNQLGIISNEVYIAYDYSRVLIPGVSFFLLLGLFDHFYINKQQQLEGALEAEQAIRKIETEKNNLVREQNVLLEKKVLERTAEILEKNEQLEALDKMKSRFFANISHEFRTPLTLIIGPAKTQLSRVNNDQQAQKHLETILSNANQLLDLINQLLDLAKSEHGQLELHLSQVEIEPWIYQQVRPFLALAETKNIQIILQGVEASVITMDLQKMSRVIDNILFNALKFSPNDSELIINVSEGDEYHRIEIIDQGAGIPNDEKKNVFKRFYQLNQKDTNVGSGIGLALAKEYVELHGGKVYVENNTPIGSKFIVEIPQVLQSNGKLVTLNPTDSGATNAPWSGEEGSAQNETIAPVSDKQSSLLIVEDNAGVRDFIKSFFEADYQVFEATDGQEGVDMAKRIIPDLIISDVMMPRIDGVFMTRKLKEDMLTSHIPIILLTAKASLEHKVEGLGTGADDYLTKPFEGDELVARVESLISNRIKLREIYGKELSGTNNREQLPLIEQRFIELAEQHILENLQQGDYDVQQLSEAMKIERSTLYRKLKAITGMTPTLFIRTIRLTKAMELLKNEQMSISEIAFAVGFSSSEYFSKIFKKQYGQVPSEVK